VHVDRFPSTHATWIEAQLTIAETMGDGSPAGAAAHRSLRQHLMERYRSPLEVYVRGSSMRGLGEPGELVAGFFAERLGNRDFLLSWRASGMPLRRWMMNGISYYGRGVMRDRVRDRMRQFPAAEDGFEFESGSLVEDRDAARAFDEAWALRMLNESIARVHADLDGAGRLDELEVFRRHVVDGMPYEPIAADLGWSRQQCANAVRRVGRRVREAMREVVRDDGVAPGEVEAAVREIIAVLMRG
jgi:hypothetical protein